MFLQCLLSSICLFSIILCNFLLQFGHLPNVDGDPQEQTRQLAERLGNLTILRKGVTDIISNGQQGEEDWKNPYLEFAF